METEGSGMFTTARHRFPFVTWTVNSTSSYPIYLQSILILVSHLNLGL
jgi:hypothetical protein